MTSRFQPFAFVELVSPYNKKNITRWLEDMNFVRVARTISPSFAALTREILFLPREHKIHIFSPPWNILYIPKILKKSELLNFSRLLNVSAWITFWMLHIKANSVFHLFNVFLHFRGQSAKKRVCNLSYSISVKSYRTFFEIGFNKYGVFVQKLLLKKSIEIKNLRTRFLFFICWSVCDTKQIFLPIWKAF